MLEELDGNFEARQKELTEKLQQLAVCLFRPENLMVDYTAQREGLEKVEEQVAAFRDSLHTEPVETRPYQPKPERRNEGFMSSSQVQYVCRAEILRRKAFLIPVR